MSLQYNQRIGDSRRPPWALRLSSRAARSAGVRGPSVCGNRPCKLPKGEGFVGGAGREASGRREIGRGGFRLPWGSSVGAVVGAGGMARALGEAADLLAGEGDAVVGFAVLLPVRLLEDAGGADQVAGLEVPLDVGLAGVVEHGDLVPAGTLLPFAAVVLVGVAGGDGDAERRSDFLDLPDAADDLEFRAVAHGSLLSRSRGRPAHPGVPSVTPKKPGREPALHPRLAWAGAERRTAEGGDFVGTRSCVLSRRCKRAPSCHRRCRNAWLA